MKNYPWDVIIGKTTILISGKIILNIKKVISILHPYLEERRSDITAGLYPQNHLWGIDALEKSDKFDLNFLSTNGIKMPTLVENLLNRSFFRNSPSATADLLAYNASKSSDYIYSVYGSPHIENEQKLINKIINSQKIICFPSVFEL
jgi:hypothetical protein